MLRIFIPWLLLDWKFVKRTDLNLGHTPDLLHQNLKMDYRNSCSQCKFLGAHIYIKHSMRLIKISVTVVSWEPNYLE